MIVVENLIKSYGNRIVLNGVNLKIEEGKIYALLGKNGAGKSTIINILSGILKYGGGKIKIDSELLGRYAYHFKRKLGCVFENSLLIEKFSPIEYLQFLAIMYDLNKKDVRNRIHYLIDIFQLEEYKDKYLSNCSKGIRKRVSVAAALLHQPKYLLLDELFEGLDFLSVQNVLRILKEYAANGGAVLIASHQFDSLIDIADSFLLLKDGNFVFESTIKELASKTPKDIKKQFENLLL